MRKRERCWGRQPPYFQPVVTEHDIKHQIQLERKREWRSEFSYAKAKDGVRTSTSGERVIVRVLLLGAAGGARGMGRGGTGEDGLVERERVGCAQLLDLLWGLEGLVSVVVSRPWRRRVALVVRWLE